MKALEAFQITREIRSFGYESYDEQSAHESVMESAGWEVVHHDPFVGFYVTYAKTLQKETIKTEVS